MTYYKYNKLHVVGIKAFSRGTNNLYNLREVLRLQISMAQSAYQ